MEYQHSAGISGRAGGEPRARSRWLHHRDRRLPARPVVRGERARPRTARQGVRARHDGRGGGRAVLFTSGQPRGPMPEELPYVLSKGAVQQMTASVGHGLASRGITVNCIDPGPTDTGRPAG
ncbi:SDR family NAD(P)-dependent oxidoreductase [Streptomyces sp. NPDC057539]|uniref:SDR family NAD(P)-dependent oxidoreductase n=1 Tax=Streptomyces sp. NPDC057539 TaxID=3346159 RepID=UPI00367D5C1A